MIEFLRKQNLRIPPELSSSSTTILIVDDDQSVGTWLLDAIKSRFPHTRVLLAADGYSAGEIVTAERPEIVILDLYMPGMDGFEVCRRIKSKENTRKTRVLAITGHHTPESVAAVLDAGAEVCLAKPIKTDELYTALGKFLPASL